jgi:hypothetical protein
MKRNTFVFVLSVFLLSACNLGATQTSVASTQVPESAIQTAIAQTQAAEGPAEIPADTLAPTVTVTAAPTEVAPTATPEFSPYGEENFDTDKSSWSYYVVSGDPVQFSEGLVPGGTSDIQNGYLNFEFNKLQVWTYAYYNRFTHQDVRIDTRVANLGLNTNMLTLFCRYDPKIGWYEFNITSGGLYSILAAQTYGGSSVSYITLADGGSNNINMGTEENELALVCKKNTLSVFINGKLAKEVTDSLNYMVSGYSGVSASSFDALPVKAGFDWVKLSEP